VQTPGGSATSESFTVARPPQLHGVAPLLAPHGAELTLDGAALYVGATAVRFDAQVAEIVRHADETRLAVRVPADAPDGPLHVATPGGTAQSAPFTVGSAWVDCVGATYAWVPAGGGLAGFWMMETPVTNAMWRAAVQAGVVKAPRITDAYGNPAKALHPVVHVRREHARAYAAWAGGRLPRDAEWTRAAQGDDGWLYPWGDPSPDETRANCRPHGAGDTTSVGSYPMGASPYGVLDMAGNVWEWVEPDGGGERPYIVRGAHSTTA
jgi:hypothetical protein